MKTIEQLSEQTLKKRLRAIYALPQSELSQEQLGERTQIEKRLWDIEVEKHPLIHTPPGFVGNLEEEW